jgi:DNA (cytosine-5)-methyltransferase 1
MYELALFAGAGGGILGGKLLGWRCIGAVECEEYPRGTLAQRQNDGCIDPFPIWTDVRTFTKRNNNCRQWIKRLRRIRHQLVITGGFPCQDISSAGKGAGIEGVRSGLWSHQARIIREIRPRYALVENSPILTSRGLGTVLGDLAAMGYNARWGVLGADDAIWSFGDPCVDHERARIWIVCRDGNTTGERWRKGWTRRFDANAERQLEQALSQTAYSNGFRCEQMEQSAAFGTSGERATSAVANGASTARQSWWANEPRVGRMVHGVDHRVDRLKAVGNGQCSPVVRLAWNLLIEGL